MKNRLRPILAFFGLILLVSIASLVPELIGGDLVTILKDKLGEYYLYAIAGAGFVTILLLTLWTDGYSLFKWNEKDTAPQAVPKDEIQKIRTSLFESYQLRIDSKLASRFPINIEVAYSRKGSSTKGHLFNKSLRISDLKKELIEIFDKQHGRLLIIGEPGAGKTTLLLQLAIKLFERGEEQIPIIINIATWRSRFSSVAEWLQELLPQMGFSKTLANRILVEKRLLPLFDGLDEVAEKERPTFLKAVASYGKSNRVRYAICSRIQEYAETVDAAVNGQVVVKPLTLSQIEQGLKETSSPETIGLLDAIKKDALLTEALTTPFYLNTAQLLFASKKTWEELEFTSDKIRAREQEIVDAFVQDSIDKFPNDSQPQIKKWLAFLANRMNRDNLVVVELTSLQYHWYRLNKKQILSMYTVFGLVYGLVLSVILSLALILVEGMVFGMVAGLLSGLILSLLFGLFAGLVRGLNEGLNEGLIKDLVRRLVKGLDEDKIVILTKDKLNWSFSSLTTSLKGRSLVFSLALGLILGLVVSLAVGPAEGLNGGLVGGLVYFLIFFLLDMLENSQSYLKTTHPYQRFYASMWSFYFSIIQHFHLRYILYKKGLLPWRLVDFLNEATKNNILESDGGSWRFRHRILQDYFAKHWEDNYAATEDGVVKEEEQKA